MIEQPPEIHRKATARLRDFAIDGAFYAGYSCVYAIAPSEWGPTKIGMATNLARRFWGLQSANWHRLFIFDVHWFAGPPVSSRVEKAALAAMKDAGKWLRGEWFNETPEVCATAIKESAKRLNLEWFSEDERRKRIGWIGRHQFDMMFARV